MKAFVIISTLCCAVVFAALVENDISALIDRANKLVNSSNQIIAEHQNNSRGHLLDSLRYEVSAVEKLVHDLHQLENVTHRSPELNRLEENLVRHENRLSEELAFVEDVYQNYNVTGKSANELIAYGERLVNEAKTAIEHRNGHGNLEVIQISSEIFQIQLLINQLRHNLLLGPVGTILEEEALVRHEHTLRALIDRLNH